jgi:hypothetical protein
MQKSKSHPHSFNQDPFSELFLQLEILKLLSSDVAGLPLGREGLLSTPYESGRFPTFSMFTYVSFVCVCSWYQEALFIYLFIYLFI